MAQDGDAMLEVPGHAVCKAMLVCGMGLASIALFFECKVITATSGMSAYLKDGIERFVTGRYASRMAHAGMLGYLVGAVKSPSVQLTKFFGRRVSKTTWTFGDQARCMGVPNHMLSMTTTVHNALAETKHMRDFYQLSPPLPGGITLRHLWLQV